MMAFRIGFVFDTGNTVTRVFEGETLDGAKLFASHFDENKRHLGKVAAAVVRALDDDGNVTGKALTYRPVRK